MPERHPDPRLEASTDRWMWVGALLIALLVLAFPLYRIYEPDARAEARERQQQSLVDQGRELWAQSCASCHGANGDGVDAPALNSRQFLTAVTDQQMASITAHGIPGTPMSAWSLDFGGPLTSQQIAAIAAFVRSWESDAPDRPDWRTPTPPPGAGHDDEEGGEEGGHDEEPAAEEDGHGDETTTGQEEPRDEPAGNDQPTEEPETEMGAELFAATCARCHGLDLGGDEGPALDASSHSVGEPDEHLLQAITFGRDEMPAFGDRLREEQIRSLVDYIRQVQAEG